ncbi:lytic transglycosylase domain-containing protein [Frankia sp. AgKG'84/4]|uniref:lytic transglycosylase domain-containing protein n=1 Tax=Frankia sp. AgKG'84/4 TaxID=573490 RepID=UPI00200BE1DD|nr:lytic transglycosylase domain-containing protein [Frankia sp. AgKG'84/4]MCL9793102.1 lytic transglycosylase domain-containing protein [Frankia sp. AgKG'84/4]
MAAPVIAAQVLKSSVGKMVKKAAVRRARASVGRRGRRSPDGDGEKKKRPWWLLAIVMVLGGNYLIIGVVLLVVVLIPGASSLAGRQGDTIVPAPSAVTGIPAVLLDAYAQAARNAQRYAPTCTGMTWSILAGIGQIESGQVAGHQIAADGQVTPAILGPRLDGTNGTARIVDTDGGRWDGDTALDRAVGPMQFIPGSWASMGRDGNDDGVADPNNVYDATAATVVHLCGRGPTNLADRSQLSRAIFSYNASDEYVANVLHWIDIFRSLGAAAGAATPGTVPGGVPAPRGTNTTDTIIGIMAKSGVPYVVTSTVRPEDTGSYHSLGQAVDFALAGADNPQLLAINQYWARYAAGLSELIYTGPGGTCVKDGMVVSCAGVYAKVVAEHHNHVHVAATPDMLRRIGVGTDVES